MGSLVFSRRVDAGWPVISGSYQRTIDMGATYHKPLYLLPFDHRSSFERGLFGAEPPVSATVHDGITRAKWIIFDANQLAIGQGEARSQCAILVDEEFGAPIARCANELEVPLAMPVERSGQAEFEFQYGDQFAEHIEAFDPTFIKVLVRCNPEGNVELNSRQTDRLARLSAWLHEHNRTFLFELLVPATPKQLELYKGHEQDYDTEFAAAARRGCRCFDASGRCRAAHLEGRGLRPGEPGRSTGGTSSLRWAERSVVHRPRAWR